MAAVLLGVGATAYYWPDVPSVGLLGRVFESLAPQILGLALLSAGLLAWLKARWLALGVALAVLAAGAGIAARHLGYAEPLARADPADLDIIWFNVLATNDARSADITAALAESGADLLILSEAAALLDDLPALAAHYPYRLGCDSACILMILSRHPFEVQSYGRMRHWRPGRLARLEVALPGAPPVTVLATHLVKPWFYGVTETDIWYVKNELGRVDGPLVVAGDFNVAPWSRRMVDLYRKNRLVPAPRAPATWPAAGGALGVPIDHVLVRGGARLTSLEPWGAGLGSNHRGLRAGISLPAPE